MTPLDRQTAQNEASRIRACAAFARSKGAHAIANRLEALASELVAFVANPRRVGTVPEVRS